MQTMKMEFTLPPPQRSAAPRQHVMQLKPNDLLSSPGGGRRQLLEGCAAAWLPVSRCRADHGRSRRARRAAHSCALRASSRDRLGQAVLEHAHQVQQSARPRRAGDPASSSPRGAADHDGDRLGLWRRSSPNSWRATPVVLEVDVSRVSSIPSASFDVALRLGPRKTMPPRGAARLRSCERPVRSPAYLKKRGHAARSNALREHHRRCMFSDARPAARMLLQRGKSRWRAAGDVRELRPTLSRGSGGHRCSPAAIGRPVGVPTVEGRPFPAGTCRAAGAIRAAGRCGRWTYTAWCLASAFGSARVPRFFR